MLWVGLFLDYTFKMIQNIQWGKGEHWPWLHLSFINFLSVKWALSERTAGLCNGSRAIHKGETRSLWFWFTSTHLPFCVCGVVWKRFSVAVLSASLLYLRQRLSSKGYSCVVLLLSEGNCLTLETFQGYVGYSNLFKLEFEQICHSASTAHTLLLHTTRATACLLFYHH